jgi:hypothetical protein
LLIAKADLLSEETGLLFGHAGLIATKANLLSMHAEATLRQAGCVSLSKLQQALSEMIKKR